MEEASCSIMNDHHGRSGWKFNFGPAKIIALDIGML